MNSLRIEVKQNFSIHSTLSNDLSASRRQQLWNQHLCFAGLDTCKATKS